MNDYLVEVEVKSKPINVPQNFGKTQSNFTYTASGVNNDDAIAEALLKVAEALRA